MATLVTFSALTLSLFGVAAVKPSVGSGLANNARPTMTAAAPAQGWQPFTAPGPDGPVYSIMHTAEALKSDPDFAGMIVRCSPKLRLQVGFALVVPFRPHARAQVTISVSTSQSHRFGATLLPPGSIVLITTDAELVARTLTESSGDVSVLIEGDHTLHGIVPLHDFRTALASLRARCP